MRQFSVKAMQSSLAEKLQEIQWLLKKQLFNKKTANVLYQIVLKRNSVVPNETKSTVICQKIQTNLGIETGGDNMSFQNTSCISIT